MSLINCKVELKLRWMKHFVLAVAGVENDSADSNNIISTIKDTKLICSWCHFISKRQSKTIKRS